MKMPTFKKAVKSVEVVTPAPVLKKTAVKKTATKKASPKVAKKVLAVTKKTAPKKVVSKKTALAKKSPSPARFVVASDFESFWVTDGQVLNSLIALGDAFKTMPTKVYDYHISASGNDFADWVETVLAAPVCATVLRKAKTAKAAHVVVTAYLTKHTS